jgi:hypothetical protein
MRQIIAVLVLGLLLVPAATAQPFTGEDDSICMTFFYSENCPHCDQVEAYLEDVGHNVTIEKHSLPTNPQLFRTYADSYGIPQDRQGYTPTMFIGDSYCIGDRSCIDLINQTIHQHSETGLACPEPTATDKATVPATLAGITGLAAVDAINPCALAVLLILLTAILSRYPDRKKKALAAGTLFSLAILLAYLAIGTLIVLGFRSVAGASSLSLPGIYRILGIFAILIGLFNLKDWLSYGLGGFKMEVPESWRPRMKSILESAASPSGAFVVGLIVSLFLLPCTSGPYFVAGGILSGMAWQEAVPLLIAYNIIFILPMLAITGIIYGGYASVETISDWREQNIERLHLLAGLILIGLGIMLLTGMI